MDKRALHKAFQAPRTIESFFKPRPAAANGGAGSSGASAASAASAPAAPATRAAPGGPSLKRAASEASAPAAKRAAAGGKGGIAAAFDRQATQQQQQQQQQQPQQHPAPTEIVDLAADDSRDGCSVAAPPAAAVQRPALHRGGSGGGGSGSGYVPAPGEVEMLTAMGFTSRQAESALRVTQGNLERAANWLLAGK